MLSAIQLQHKTNQTSNKISDPSNNVHQLHINPKEPEEIKEKHLFLGCDPKSNDLPAQFPYNGGRSMAMCSWYTKHAKLSFRDSAILKEICACLNYNDFTSKKYKRIGQDRLAEGTGCERYCVSDAIQSLLSLGLIEMTKLTGNARGYRLTDKIPNAYTDYFKKTFPHKFKSKNNMDIKDKGCDQDPHLNVCETHIQMYAGPTTSYLNIPNNILSEIDSKSRLNYQDEKELISEIASYMPTDISERQKGNFARDIIRSVPISNDFIISALKDMKLQNEALPVDIDKIRAMIMTKKE